MSATPETKANGERIIKKSELGETQYVSANYIVRNKTVISKHIFAGNQRVASTVSMKDNCGTVSEKNTMYFHPDHLGSSSYVTDKKGNFFEMIEYLPYGETLYDEAATVDKTEFRFTGHLKDDETGFYYCHARYYDPKLVKFISPDDRIDGLFSSAGQNMYMYCHGNPIMFNDPDGHGFKDALSWAKTKVQERAQNEIKLVKGVIDKYILGKKESTQSTTNQTSSNTVVSPTPTEPITQTTHYNGVGVSPQGYTDTSADVNVRECSREPNTEFWNQFNPGYGSNNMPGPHHDDPAGQKIDIGKGQRGGRSDWYGPNQLFSVNVHVNASGYGGLIIVKMGEKQIKMGHFTDISQEVVNASNHQFLLAPGTFLGYTDQAVGYSTGAHIHMQGAQGGNAVSRETFWGWLLGQ